MIEAGDEFVAAAVRERPRVLLVDDHPAIRVGIRMQLAARGVDVVGEAGDGAAALVEIHRTRPSVVVADIRMPVVDGLDLIRKVREEGLDTRIVLLSAATEAHLVQRALDLGASGFVGKDSVFETIATAIEVVAGGDRYVDPLLLASLVTQTPDHLTPRELQILQHAADGMQNKVIALELGISEETVKSHLSKVMRKLQSASRTEAVAAGLRRSLIS